MEISQQELPVVFSQMLQMFPNVPQDIVWLYVQRYSHDVEKCAQMLNLQSGKFSALQSSPTRDCINLNDCYSENEIPHLLSPPRIITDNNNDLKMTENLPLRTEENANYNQVFLQNEPCSRPLNLQIETSTNLPSRQDSNGDFSKNLSNRNFHEPLSLQINTDEDGSIHSWRPNLDCNLSSDFFLPSPMFENIQFDSNNQVLSLHPESHFSEIQMHSDGMGEEQRRYSSGNSLGALPEYPAMTGNVYSIDIPSHLHYQKSQMNAIRYEVIKAKIDLNDLKESIEKLSYELKEKMQSKSAQDIEILNSEIVKLRLECQCLCSEVDNSQKDQVLLGEIDESYYEEKNPESKRNADSGSVQKDFTSEQNADDLNKWQCPKCTFDNHPAITSCEMCHLMRPNTECTEFMHVSSNACYPHNDESVTVTS